jgi:hypothetical protein
MLVFLSMLAVYADYAGWIPGRTIYAGILGVTLSKLAGYFVFVVGWLAGWICWLSRLLALLDFLSGYLVMLAGCLLNWGL